jgi:hypothetical protein
MSGPYWGAATTSPSPTATTKAVSPVRCAHRCRPERESKARTQPLGPWPVAATTRSPATAWVRSWGSSGSDAAPSAVHSGAACRGAGVVVWGGLAGF